MFVRLLYSEIHTLYFSKAEHYSLTSGGCVIFWLGGREWKSISSFPSSSSHRACRASTKGKGPSMLCSLRPEYFFLDHFPISLHLIDKLLKILMLSSYVLSRQNRSSLPLLHCPAWGLQCFPHSVSPNCSKYIQNPWTSFSVATTPLPSCVQTIIIFSHRTRESGTAAWPVLVSPGSMTVMPGTPWPPEVEQRRSHQSK